MADNLDLFYLIDKVSAQGGEQTKLLNQTVTELLKNNRSPGRSFVFLTYLFRVGYLDCLVDLKDIDIESLYPWKEFYRDIYFSTLG